MPLTETLSKTIGLLEGIRVRAPWIAQIRTGTMPPLDITRAGKELYPVLTPKLSRPVVSPIHVPAPGTKYIGGPGARAADRPLLNLEGGGVMGEVPMPSTVELLGRRGAHVERVVSPDIPLHRRSPVLQREPNTLDPLATITGGGRGGPPGGVMHPGYIPSVPRTGRTVMREPNLVSSAGDVMPQMGAPPPTATEQMVETVTGPAVSANKPFPTGLVAGGVLAGLGIYSLFDRDEYSMESNRPVY